MVKIKMGIRIGEMNIATVCNPVETISAIPTSPNVVEQPCNPTPCGPNSVCRPVGNSPVCSCQPGYLGVPPECRPECVSNSECAPSQACVNLKCQDPCPGTCGRDAQCRVVNHNPICVCPSGYTGDPLTGCHIQPSKHGSSLLTLQPKITNVLITTIYICSTYSKSRGGRRKTTTPPTKSLQSTSMRIKFAMPSGWWTGTVFLSSEYDRNSTKLSPRMHCGIWLSVVWDLR